MDTPNNQEQVSGSYDPSKVSTLDDFFSFTQNIGSIAQAGSDTMYGYNQFKTGGNVPANNDTQGFVFFTRPMLNLNKWNLIRHRELYPLLTNDELSIQRFVRCTLDPSLEHYSGTKVTTPMMDNKTAFIPLMTNTILKLSGWPDVVAPVYTSKQGVRKEQWAIIDGTTENNESFDLDATFLNIADDPLGMLIHTWVTYASGVFDGQLKPYAGFEASNSIDYTTRIYRIVMDKSSRYVKKIACTIASFPINVPTGKYFDYDRLALYTTQTKEINVRFKCMGCVYNDDIIIKWFNKTSGYANPALKAVVHSKFDPNGSHGYDVIPRSLLPKFKHRGYPLINTNTYELEWWIDRNSVDYKRLVSPPPAIQEAVRLIV